MSALDKLARNREKDAEKESEIPPLEPPFPYVAIPVDARFFGVGYSPQSLPPEVRVERDT